MKNKKLFAILTLVCFMFTLMPVAAFAAPADTDVVTAYDGNNWGGSVYVTADARNAVAVKTDATVATGAAFYVLDAEGNAKQIKYTTGQATDFIFAVAGTYTVYAVIDDGANTDNSGDTDLAELVAAANSLVDDQTVANAVAKIQAKLRAQTVKTPAYITVDAQEANYTILVDGSATPANVNVKADSGFSAAGVQNVTVNLKNNGSAVVGKVPTITAPGYVTVAPAYPNKTVTDVAGNIVYAISADRAGNFNVVFSYEDATEVVLGVDAYDNAIANVEVVKESASLINKAKDNNGEVATGAIVKFTDANGVVISTTGTVPLNSNFLNGGNEVKVTVVSQPTTSRLQASNVKLATSSVTGAPEVVITGLTSDLKVGSYAIKFALENGKSVTVDFEAAKYGNTVGIRFVDPATTIALGESAPAFTVVAYDANGVTDTSVAYTLSYNGKAWDGNNSKVNTAEKYIGSTITVLAKTNDNKFVATTTLEVVDNGMEVVYANNTAEVGVTTTLVANLVDAKGNKVAATTNSAVSIVVLEKPENAYVYATAPAMTAGDENINVTFLGSVAGEYKIQTIVVDANNEYVTGVETITVGGNDTTFKDVIVMSIGAKQLVKNSEVIAMPAAPEIVDSRTMVPARAGLEAFGATVVWDEVTRTVTAELNGVKVVMEIGEKVYTVNGVAVVGDAAPYITAASTMVPVSFFTNAFGIVATPIYDDYGVCDVLFTK